MNTQVKSTWLVFTGQQWLNSLKIFLPPEINFFSLLSLNSFIRTWQIVLRYFWWLLLAIPAIIFLQSYAIQYSFYANIGLSLIQTLVIFILYLAIRPSVQPKDYQYFFSYVKHCLIFWFYFIVLMFVASGIFSVALLMAFSMHIGGLLAFFMHACSTLAIAVFMFSFFFFLDSQLSFKNLNLSFWRGIKMVWYGLPFILICLAVFNLLEKTIKHFIYGLLYLKVPLFSVVLVYGSYFILFSLLLCMFNVFYNKRIAETFVRYF